MSISFAEVKMGLAKALGQAYDAMTQDEKESFQDGIASFISRSKKPYVQDNLNMWVNVGAQKAMYFNHNGNYYMLSNEFIDDREVGVICKITFDTDDTIVLGDSAIGDNRYIDQITKYYIDGGYADVPIAEYLAEIGCKLL